MSRAPIGLFYGSSTCYTEMAGEKIRGVLGEDRVDIFNVADTPIITAQFYPHLIFGIPTWDYGELQEDWEEIWGDLDELELSGKTVALYGLGDQVGYPEWFQDALGYLHSKILARGARPCGYWPRDGYEFEASKALTPDETHFVGLPLDEENEFQLTDERIRQWCAQIEREFGL
ncbi:flavodoxin FldB [Marinimicrobium sp. ABcell2]|uniref:flavodoxin FldB n=1 Tax=Marinimicrobium sp. ABcell2 TaxID=3069751 RepID=UPI0027B6E831|nr:flavodoxin FldB [Marinimicrobium sp. ABcell2]MDQ2075215.1 flavodoxin FldB [Marinimicrobium sp. ABcell2]